MGCQLRPVQELHGLIEPSAERIGPCMDASISNPSPCRRVSLGGCGCSTKKRQANQLSRPEERLSAGEAGHPPAAHYYPSIGARRSTLLTHIFYPCS